MIYRIFFDVSKGGQILEILFVFTEVQKKGGQVSFDSNVDNTES